MKNHSVPRSARSFTIKNALLLTLAALLLWALPTLALADGCIAQTNWILNGTGNWFDDANWDNHVPDDTTAYINNGGKATIGLSVGEACNLILGYDPTDSGTLSLDHGRLDVRSEVEVGGYGKGNLIVTNGGIVTAYLLTIAALEGNPDSAGTVSVDGSTFTITTRADVGGDIGTPGGIALLSVTNGGSVSASNLRVYSSGTLTGNGTVSTTNGTTVDGTVAPNGGGGTLTFGGGLQLNLGATTQCKITPQDPSTTPQVSVSAQASLGGRLSVTMTGDFSSAPPRFTLLYADSFDVNHRTFDSQSIMYPTGQGCWVPQITYDYTGGHVHVYLDRVYNCN